MRSIKKPNRPFASIMCKASLCFALLMLAGCINLINTPPAPKRVLLSPPLPEKIEATRTKQMQIMVSQPSAWIAIDTDAIALLLPNREIRYLSGVRFAGTMPRLAQGFLVDALTSTEAFQGVGTDSSGIVANSRLFGDVRIFALRQDEEGKPPTSIFEGTFRLLDRQNGIVLGTLPINLSQQATDTSLQAMLAAHEIVIGKLLEQISSWVVKTLEAQPESKP